MFDANDLELQISDKDAQKYLRHLCCNFYVKNKKKTLTFTHLLCNKFSFVVITLGTACLNVDEKMKKK
jgi:hypothetical protein